MVKVTILFLVLSLSNSLCAQDSVEMRIKPRMTVEEVIPFNKLYLYPQFTQGVVCHVSGAFSTAMLNYNVLLQEMQFLTNSNDTLAFSEASGVNYVVIQSDTFYYDKSFYQLVNHTDP